MQLVLQPIRAGERLRSEAYEAGMVRQRPMDEKVEKYLMSHARAKLAAHPIGEVQLANAKAEIGDLGFVGIIVVRCRIGDQWRSFESFVVRRVSIIS